MAKTEVGRRFDVLCWDSETSGLGQRAEILEFGGILLDGETFEEKDSILSLIRPSDPSVLETDDAKKALSMNHLAARKDELLEAPTKHEFIKRWWKMRQKYRKGWIPAGYNIGNFDLPKLRYLFFQIRKEKPLFKIEDFFHYHVLDAMCVYIADNWFTGKSRYVRLMDACKAYGVKNETAHSALSDARATAELLRRMMLPK